MSTFKDKLKEDYFPNLRNSLHNLKGRTLEGKVYYKDSSYLYLDLGSKKNPRLSSRFVSRALDSQEVSALGVGKSLDFTINEMETMEGDLLINIPKKTSHDPKVVWKAIKEHYQSEEPIIGRLLNPIKGGFSVGFAGFIAFLPNSHLVKGRSPSYSHWLKRTRPYIGALLYFKILELNPHERNFVVSRIEALTPEGTLRRPSKKKSDKNIL